MCPDLAMDRDNITLQNAQENRVDRESFAIEIWKCDRTENKACKDEDEVRRFLNEAKFSVILNQGEVDFKSKVKDSIHFGNILHSQFQVRLEDHINSVS
jgi:hypothetical protein